MLRAALAVLAACLAGCFGTAGGGGDTDDGASSSAGGTSDPSATVAASAGPRGAEAPLLEPGDWWRWRVEGRGYGAFEMTTVVASAAPGQVEFAVTDAQEALPAHIFHVPPIGVASLPDLGWLAHGEPMDLLRFPLEDGKTWAATVEGMPVEFTATAVPRDGRTVFEVDGRFTEGDDQGPRYVYDPDLRMFSEVHVHYGGDTPFSSAVVVDSGRGYEGDVLRHEVRDKFLGGSGGLDEAGAPTGQFTATPEKEWLVFGCYLGGSTGRFEITYVPPVSNEGSLQCGSTHQGMAFADEVQVLWRASVPGQWSVVFGVVGDGYAEAEVLGVVEEPCHLGAGTSDAPPCG